MRNWMRQGRGKGKGKRRGKRGGKGRGKRWNDVEKEVDRGRKQTGDEMLLPKQSY